jgi:hypothetical protein
MNRVNNLAATIEYIELFGEKNFQTTQIMPTHDILRLEQRDQ